MLGGENGYSPESSSTMPAYRSIAALVIHIHVDVRGDFPLMSIRGDSPARLPENLALRYY